MKILKKYYQYSLDGKLLHIFEGVRKAAESVNTDTSAIVACCKGKSVSSCGYIWMESDDKAELADRMSKIPAHKLEAAVLEGEEWRDIKGTEGLYQVSNRGRVRAAKRRGTSGGILKSTLWGAGYPCVNIGGRRNHKPVNIHRLVANAFLPNPNNLPCVNHKDEDKTNNCVENLEWCSYQYNNTYGIQKDNLINHPSISIPVMQMSKEGELIACYPSVTEAQRITGISRNVIYNMIKGNESTGGGYIWKPINN